MTQDSGTKHDKGKPLMHLLPMSVLKDVAVVLTFGKEKYGENDWQKFVMSSGGQRRYLSAALRHIAAYQEGRSNDEETSMPHLIHAICCLLFIAWSGRSFHDDKTDA